MLGNKNVGLVNKYEVKKTSNPSKKVDAIVLEFDDPIARVGIRAWADEMLRKGYEKVATDVYKKLVDAYEDDKADTALDARPEPLPPSSGPRVR